ncbi:hypothetical protein HN018_27370 (plasmid) [Lichenicola cladoniae]|uniref:Uncharacterized protein n=1 Tax=Lichenicola cladoniae TaxID=1484109 RepID=A0A6M8HZ20_9PROT|nr:hypothetical protein [Lichenicola cladoniae]NPD69999.1 hypothetical protein [Acetobacteraceae bacterium]QKE93814.1 hypothetical protein HN018_27370 [Lichenicola cladoniae]
MGNGRIHRDYQIQIGDQRSGVRHIGNARHEIDERQGLGKATALLQTEQRDIRYVQKRLEEGGIKRSLPIDGPELRQPMLRIARPDQTYPQTFPLLHGGMCRPLLDVYRFRLEVRNCSGDGLHRRGEGGR